MNLITRIFDQISANYTTPAINTQTILSVLLMVLLLSAYECFVYRFVSHRAFYNRSFNISVTVLPFFIATIILCLQSNLVITLGTIGALAIIRYRTAVKDPVDMMYILWAIHTGIICGCQLYEISVLTSLTVTAVLLILENVHFGRKPYIAILRTHPEKEAAVLEVLKNNTKSQRIKSRCYTKNDLDLAVEFSVGDIAKLSAALQGADGVERFSLIEYDSEDIL